MGQNLSINQSSYENVSNQVSQISNEECINFCSNDTNFIVNQTGGDIGNLKIGQGCFINSPSCVLKASLDTELINTLSNIQKSEISTPGGIFGALDQLASIGNSESIDESNYQNIVNQSTQQMNSLCMNHVDVGGTIVYNISGGRVKNLILGKKGQISKSRCVIDNMSKFYAQNSETNEQTAKIEKTAIGAGLLLIILIIIIGLVSKHHKKHKPGDGAFSEDVSFGKQDSILDDVKALQLLNETPSAPPPLYEPSAPPPTYKAAMG